MERHCRTESAARADAASEPLRARENHHRSVPPSTTAGTIREIADTLVAPCGRILGLPPESGEDRLIPLFVDPAVELLPTRFKPARLFSAASIALDQRLPERPARLQAVVPPQPVKPQ